MTEQLTTPIQGFTGENQRRAQLPMDLWPAGVIVDRRKSIENGASAEPLVEASTAVDQAADEASQNRWQRIVRGAETGVAATVLLPSNEAIRAGAFAAGYSLMPHSPAVGALTIGASTFALEAAGGLAAADLFKTERSARIMNWLRRRMKHTEDDEALSGASKMIATFMGGTVVGMALENYEDPDRTVAQNRRYSLKTSAWLGGVCAAVFGAGGTEALNYTIDHPTVTGAVAGGAIATVEGGRRVASRLRVPKPVEDIQTEKWLDHDKHYEYRLVEDEEALHEVAELEQQVWDEKGFGNLTEEGYDKYNEHSRVFAAYDGDRCIGMTRMFKAEDGIVPPFLDMEFYEDAEHEKLTASAVAGLTEELGTAAVLQEARGRRVNTRLWRQAYRDAVLRGVKQWGIIMEPERVEKDLNGRYGFTFRQLGPAVDYQGGACAPFVMDLQEVSKSMQKKKPLSHFWFVRKSLKA
ncbi:MAG TPA: hypothetical protein VFH39_02240 [Candidatus Saccharimonadales bacterium]|nr:hypothetical protein [Candidatus Saccharimonadales bacterium]